MGEVAIALVQDVAFERRDVDRRLDNVVGEPLFVYWSYDAPRKEDWVAENLATRLKFDLSIIWNFFPRTRWSRTGQTF